jgi:hypothetical protein
MRPPECPSFTSATESLALSSTTNRLGVYAAEQKADGRHEHRPDQRRDEAQRSADDHRDGAEDLPQAKARNSFSKVTIRARL